MAENGTLNIVVIIVSHVVGHAGFEPYPAPSPIVQKKQIAWPSARDDIRGGEVWWQRLDLN
jgi:hypothetical protein